MQGNRKRQFYNFSGKKYGIKISSLCFRNIVATALRLVEKWAGYPRNLGTKAGKLWEIPLVGQ